MRCVCLRFVFILCGLAACGVAQAQQAGRIVAVVNDDIITRYDLIARLGIALSSSNVEDTPEVRQRLGSQILHTLMDERLQSQEAVRFGINVNEREIAEQIADIEKRNNLQPGGLDRFFRSNRLDIEALKEHLRVEAAWNKLLARRVAPRVEVGIDEVEARLAERRAAVGSSEYVVSEIFLALNDPAQEREVRAAADGIVAQLRGGASFAALARQFSQSSSAAIGGDLGRVRAGQLDSRLEAALNSLETNGFSPPVRLENGFYILLLRERSVIEGSASPEVEFALKRLHFAAPEGAGPAQTETLRERAAAVGSTVAGCTDMERAAAEAGIEEPVDAGRVKLGNLPERLQGEVSSLEPDIASNPIPWEGGFLVLMVCERIRTPEDTREREEIARQLRLERINRRADRYLQDLRRTALIFRRK